MRSLERTDTVVVGAGPAGLAVAACLKGARVPFVLLEQHDRVGSAWHRHYERLHLHTDKARSALPYLPYPETYPRYPSRRQVIDYLEAYARHFELAPRFGQRVMRAFRREVAWHTETEQAHYVSSHLVVATGYNRKPHAPRWPGQESFHGQVLHSADYRDGAPFHGQRVLVIGFGNSGAEIAIDLHEHGARPVLSVRSPVNIIPRELFGIPILAISILLARLPPRLVDAINAPILRLRYGDLSRLGLRKRAHGPRVQIRTTARIPVIDVGTVALIRQGHVAVRPGVVRFDAGGVRFEDGREDPFDAVVLATGYRPGLEEFLGSAAAGSGGHGETGRRGLYFCGFNVVETGTLREIGLEAERIAADIARRPSPASTSR